MYKYYRRLSSALYNSSIYKTSLIKNQSTQANGSVFNKKLHIKFLDRSSIAEDAHVYDYLKDHVAKDVCDRVKDLNFHTKKLDIFNLSSCSGLITRNIDQDRVNSFIQGDISPESLKRCQKLNIMLPPKFPISYIECDEESIPVQVNSVDLVMSCLNLHWVNDLVSCFNQVHKVLRKDSAFIGALLGGDTLYELRSSLQLAELERLSGFSAHLAPKTTGQDIARLLQASGFQLITVDISEIRICYPSIFELMFDLKGMGESNASIIGSRHMHREVLQASAAIYQQLYGSDNSLNGVPATFQIIHFIAWKDPTKSTPIKET